MQVNYLPLVAVTQVICKTSPDTTVVYRVGHIETNNMQMLFQVFTLFQIDLQNYFFRAHPAYVRTLLSSPSTHPHRIKWSCARVV